MTIFGAFDYVVFSSIVVFVTTCTVVSKLPHRGKLHVLRWGILVALTVCINMPVKSLDKLRLPMYWLRHYVWGSGRALQVPSATVKEARKVFVEAVVRCLNGYGYDNVPNFRVDNRVYGSKYMVYHSTLYEGRGFEGRPTLFYLLGGFTFLLRRDGKVSGQDHYDWHPNEDGKYFTSPLGKGAIVEAGIALLQKVFSADWFCLPGDEQSVTGEAGISNRLWDDLHEVGAREFNSWFDQVEILTDDDDLAFYRAANGFGWEEISEAEDEIRELCEERGYSLDEAVDQVLSENYFQQFELKREELDLSWVEE